MKLNTLFTKITALIVSIGLMIPTPAYAARPLSAGNASGVRAELRDALMGSPAAIGARLVERHEKRVSAKDITANLKDLNRWTSFGDEEESKEFFNLAEDTRAMINTFRTQNAGKAHSFLADLYKVMIAKIDENEANPNFKIWTKPQNEVEVELWAATGQISGLVPGVPMADLSGRKSQAEIDATLEGNPEITAYQRFADAGGSSIDLRGLQKYLNKLGVMWLDDITSTTVISSQFKVNLKLSKAASADINEYVMVSRKFSQKLGKIVEQEMRVVVRKDANGNLVDAETGKSIFNKNGQISMKYAFADMMNMLGVWGVKGRFETVDPISEVGGFGRSGASLAMFLDAASMLSGIPLTRADKQAELIFLENERYGGLTGGQETGSTLSGKPVQFSWMEFVRDRFGRFVFGGGTTLNTSLHDPATGMSEDEYLNGTVLGALRMVQPGLEFVAKTHQDGSPVLDADGDPVYGPADTRTAGLINTVWTWLLDHAEGLLLHLEKTGLANQSLFGLRNGLLDLTIRAGDRHRVVRNQLDRLYLRVTLGYMRMDEAKKAAMFPAERGMLDKFVALAEGKSGEDSPILKAYIARFIEESGAGKLAEGQTIAEKVRTMTQAQVDQVASHSLYSLTSEAFLNDYIVDFCNKIQPRKDGKSWKTTDKDLPVGAFLVGAGGPGTNIVLAFKNSEIAEQFDAYMKSRGFPMFVNKPLGANGEVGYENVIKTRTTGGLLRGFMKVDTGKPMEYKNWPAASVQKEKPVIGIYDQTTGTLTVSNEDYPKFAYLPRVRPQTGALISEEHASDPYRVRNEQYYDILAETGREFVINGNRITVGEIKGGKVRLTWGAMAYDYAAGEALQYGPARIIVKQVFSDVDVGKVSRVILSIQVHPGLSLFVQNENSAFNVQGSARAEKRDPNFGGKETLEGATSAEVMAFWESLKSRLTRVENGKDYFPNWPEGRGLVLGADLPVHLEEFLPRGSTRSQYVESFEDGDLFFEEMSGKEGYWDLTVSNDGGRLNFTIRPGVAAVPNVTLRDKTNNDPKGIADIVYSVQAGKITSEPRFFDNLWFPSYNEQGLVRLSMAASEITEPIRAAVLKAAAESGLADADVHLELYVKRQTRNAPVTLKIFVRSVAARREIRTVEYVEPVSAEVLRTEASIASGIAWLQKNAYIFGKGFGYDLRINDSLAEAQAAVAAFYDIGRTLGGTGYLKRLDQESLRALVTADHRPASDALRMATIQGLADEGIQVVTQADGTVITTGLTSRMSLEGNFDLGIQETGSHNPPAGNGAKITLQGEPLYGPALMKLFEDTVNRQGWSKTISPREVTKDTGMIPNHVEGLIKATPQLKNPLPIIVDYRGGVASTVFTPLARAKGYENTIYLDAAEADLPDAVFATDRPVMVILNAEPAPDMKHGRWDPSVDVAYENIQKLQRRIQEDPRFKAQAGYRPYAGVVFDGDGDRAGFANEDGVIFAPDRMLIAYYEAFLKQNVAGIRALNKLGHTVKMALDVRASAVIVSVIEKLRQETGVRVAGEFIAAGYPNHRSFVKEELTDIQAVLAEKGDQLDAAERQAVEKLMLGYVSAEASGHFFLMCLSRTSS